MLKGWSNIITLSCVIVAAIIEASQQALSDAPRITALFPAWVSGNFWHYVPLGLLIIAGFTWLLGRFLGPSGVTLPDRSEHRRPASKGVRTAAMDEAGKKLVIHLAVYGAGPKDQVLATDELQSAARDALLIQVDSRLGNLLSHDPAVGVRKRLDVEYSYGSDAHIHTSRLEALAGKTVHLLLPEDSKVQEAEQLTHEIEGIKQQYEVE